MHNNISFGLVLKGDLETVKPDEQLEGFIAPQCGQKTKAPDNAGALVFMRSRSDQYFATTGALPQSPNL